MIENPLVQQFLLFGLYFASTLVTLLFYSIFAWVIASWLILFGAIRPDNRVFGFLTQLVYPVIKPFRWARIGMVDLSPIAAIFALNLALSVLHSGLQQLLS